jgi:hypothetical protein
VGFVVDKVALGQVLLQVLRFSLASIIPYLLHTHVSLPHEVCDSSDQAVNCHTLGPKLVASLSVTRHLAGKRGQYYYYYFNVHNGFALVFNTVE